MKVNPKQEDFNIAVICAKTLESDAVQAVFDGFWEDNRIKYKRAEHDTNTYTAGKIGDYNVVLAHMPDYGTWRAATVVANFRHTFPGIKIGFVVGVCGGAPKGEDDKDIFLGDVVVSTAVVEYDLGHQLSNEFRTRDPLGSMHNEELKAFLNQMRGDRERMLLKDKTAMYLVAQPIFPTAKPEYPGVDMDNLIIPTHLHKHHKSPSGTECKRCQESEDAICESARRSSCAVLNCNQHVIRTAATNQGTITI
jgi:hypothetical protein